MEKKNEYVFNIGFNKNNAEHRKTVEHLNQLGHTKADYIAKAVLFYDTNSGKGSGNELYIDYGYLEQMVRKILEKQNSLSEKSQEDTYGASSLNNPQEMKLEDEDMSGILQALEGFRK